MTFNPWHEVEIEKTDEGSVRAIVEIPKNSRAKYELDKDSGMLILDRVLYSSINYPANYGFIPKTYCDDDDPLDILVISQIEIVPMCLIEATIIGAMNMMDGGDKDDKLIAVATHDMSVNHIKDISELPAHHIRELRSFFEDYKKLENKTVVVEDFLGRDAAIEILDQSIIDYNKKFAKTHSMA